MLLQIGDKTTDVPNFQFSGASPSHSHLSWPNIANWSTCSTYTYVLNFVRTGLFCCRWSVKTPNFTALLVQCCTFEVWHRRNHARQAWRNHCELPDRRPVWANTQTDGWRSMHMAMCSFVRLLLLLVNFGILWWYNTHTHTHIHTHTHTHTHAHPFNGPLSRTTWVIRNQKGKNQSRFY